MIKRTLYFGNPSYLSLNNRQLIVRLPEVEKNDTLTESFRQQSAASIPIEDIGVLILDNRQITLTHALLSALLDNNTAVITSDETHLPNGLFLPLAGNSVQTEKFKHQIEASVPLKKQLWQQTVAAKINNQAAILQNQNLPHQNMIHWAQSVKSGDADNHEARASAHYWETLSSVFYKNQPGKTFRRHRNGEPPNNLLNYGYAILRAIIARALVSSGLLPTLGIFHRNKYNAYCLADDIMEPYRPVVDKLVIQYVQSDAPVSELDLSAKKHLLSITTLDVLIENERSPLLIAISRTTASLARCFEGTQRKISYPSVA
ncbi:MAG: type II CRISPR-associated endonuclease Cas1 [Bacteroidia bacterium]|nr:type II CRISPR-associated endonuclease Cas1 [Bacteroidia bacterium]